MFSVLTYNNASESNKVHKNITLLSEYPGTLKEECSLINPVILIETASVPTFNYVQIPIFNRYYYVTGITSVRTNLWQISLAVDVLMTYEDAILANSAKIERQENVYDMYIPDPLITTENVSQVVTKKIGSSEFASCGFVLITQ